MHVNRHIDYLTCSCMKPKGDSFIYLNGISQNIYI